MYNSSTVRLPLLARKRTLPRLPKQQDGISYLVFSGACPEPENFVCYIAEHQGKTRARIIAYVSTDGFVYRTDAPLQGSPRLSPALAIGIKQGAATGGIYLRMPEGLKRIGSYHGSPQKTMREDTPLNGPGSYASGHSLGYREFMAALFLHYCVIAPEEAHAQEDAAAAGAGDTDLSLAKLAEPIHLFADIQTMPLPDAIDMLLYRIDAKENPSGVERYARTVFSAIDLHRLRRLAQTGGMTLARIERMQGYYINFDHYGASEEDAAFVLSVEAALNRVSHVLDFIGSSSGPISFSPSEEACSIIDLRTLEGATSVVRALVAESPIDNPWAQLGTVAAEPGGSWDVRTRMAHICEGLNLTVRLSYSFRLDEQSRSMHVGFTPPTWHSMPTRVFGASQGTWRDLDVAERGRLAREYAARMALILAAAAFASGMQIERCAIEELSFAGTAPLIVAFDRRSFLANMVPFADRLAKTPLWQHEAADALVSRTISEGQPPAIASRPLKTPREDPRALPPELQDMLLADTASELEVMEQKDDPALARVKELHELALTDQERAANGLVKLIEELQAQCVASELMADHPVISQYCDNYLGRLLLGMGQSDRTLRVNRVPDALFNAQYELANMYARAEMYEQALVEAQKLVDMATTSSAAHFALINVLARLERYEEVIEAAKHGLSVCFEQDSAAYYLYRAAFAFWNTGDRETALACYRMVPRGDGIRATAQSEMHALMAEMGVAQEPDYDEARAQLTKAKVPVAPTAEVTNFIADVAVLLTDHDFRFLASRCVFVLWRTAGRDELSVVHKSLAW